MNLNNNAWHVRWFHFVQGIIGHNSYGGGTTLCHFMRVTLLWGPFLFSFLAALVAAVAVVLVIGPFIIGGWTGMFAMWGVMAAIIGVIFGLVFLVMEYRPSEGGAVHCILTFLKAAKAKVCPLINFESR